MFDNYDVYILDEDSNYDNILSDSVLSLLSFHWKSLLGKLDENPLRIYIIFYYYKCVMLLSQSILQRLNYL